MPKKMKVGLSTTALPFIEIHQPLADYMNRVGLETLEINLNFFPISWSRKKHLRIKNFSLENKIDLVLHAPNSLLDPVNPDEEVAEASLGMLKSTLKLSRLLGAKYYIVHSTWYHGSLEQNIDAIHQLREATRIPILFENSGSGIGSSERDIEEILDKADVLLNFDIGHAWRAIHQGNLCGWEDFFSIFSDKIVYSHLHDNNGKEDLHLALGRGNIPFKEVFPNLYECRGDWVIEVHSQADILPSVEYIKNFLEHA